MKQVDTNDILAHLAANWRTTANGLLSALIAVIVAIAALPAGARPYVYALAGLRALVGFIQSDAGKTLAVTSGGVKAVDSHEIPNDPANKMVNK